MASFKLWEVPEIVVVLPELIAELKMAGSCRLLGPVSPVAKCVKVRKGEIHQPIVRFLFHIDSSKLVNVDGSLGLATVRLQNRHGVLGATPSKL